MTESHRPLDETELAAYLTEIKAKIFIDATHPYAEEVTRNIRAACSELGIVCYRLLRSSQEISGCTKAGNMDELVSILNSSDKVILSTLGSKELPKLAEVKDHGRRIWVRALPNDDVRKSCEELGFSRDKLILEKGPFTAEQNIAHIKLSAAEVLVTKESGAAGGFPEKLSAAAICGAEVIVLERPDEEGFGFDEIKKILAEMR